MSNLVFEPLEDSKTAQNVSTLYRTSARARVVGAPRPRFSKFLIHRIATQSYVRDVLSLDIGLATSIMIFSAVRTTNYTCIES